ncbi:MAG: winged helix-turn-helix transcriptional regulator [Syntrophomonadaceae bacterium]|jgi:ArsR family transcriptional regulator|nr:winged helix-turn-helix transcriptional regulator [Syntrophomonadaceae bacterium]
MFESIFKALGEPTRLKIIKLLADRELCVCDLEEIMKISQPRISQHLKVLKHAGLVNERKEGQRTICSLNRKFLNNTIEQFEQYLSKPLETVPELAEESSRMPTIYGESCMKKYCEKVL